MMRSRFIEIASDAYLLTELLAVIADVNEDIYMTGKKCEKGEFPVGALVYELNRLTERMQALTCIARDKSLQILNIAEGGE